MDARDASPLFQPLTVRGLTLRNRLVMSAMTRAFSPEGVPGEDVAAYYRRRAENDVGLVITEGVGIDHPLALDNPRIPVMAAGAPLDGWRRVVEAVHGAGGVIFPQLWHQGPLRDPRLSRQPAEMGQRPSGLWGPVGMHSLDPAYLEAITAPTRPMTDSEIQDVIDAFARSARLAREAGFDGIALHGGHGYLIDAFLWAGTNRRDDRYGGDLTARTTFAVELVRAIRGAVGDMPILFRFSQHKQQDYKARLAETPAELEQVLGPIAAAGVDIFDASIRQFDQPAFEGSDLNLAGWAKKVTGRLSMTVGGIGLNNLVHDTLKNSLHYSLKGDPETRVADNVPRVVERFRRGEFDLVGVGRALLSDPAWVRKLRTGEAPAPFDKSALARLT
jgi:2,4-dienoyl-CoA reductase-like NADH-dependent reductase (Old Yellow Enzyme family)